MTTNRLTELLSNIRSAETKCARHENSEVRENGFYSDGAFYDRRTGEMLALETGISVQ